MSDQNFTVFLSLVLASASAQTGVYRISCKFIYFYYVAPPYWIRFFEFLNYELSGTNFTQIYSYNLNFGHTFWNRYFFFFNLLHIRNQHLQKALRVGSIPTLHLETFQQLYWTTTWRKNSIIAQWQAQSRYLCHCAFLVSFRYAGSEKTWSNHFISISLAVVTLLAVLRR